MLLWLWCRPGAVAQIRPLAWVPPYAAGVAPKRPKKDFYEQSYMHKVVNCNVIYNNKKVETMHMFNSWRLAILYCIHLKLCSH